MMLFSDELIAWYRQNKRDLPWRNTNNAYIIWLSEIILQQTRVEQGLPYFNRFLEAYPTVTDFAAAPEDDILRLWQGLGYYSRGRNMLVTAKLVQQHYGGKFPTSYEQLIKLKGIGEYTAAAIASFSADEPRAVVDGNVYRVIARYFGISEPINSTQGKKIFQQMANDLLNRERPGLHNQAMMEFGATLCKPKNPACGVCPVRLGCHAFKHNAINTLPVKLNKLKIRERHFNYLLITDEQDRVLIHKRGDNDIWANLYELPLIETLAQATPQEVLSEALNLELINCDSTIKKIYPIKKHILTHQRLWVQMIEVEAKIVSINNNFSFIERKNLKKLAMPQILFIFLTNFLN